MKLKILRRPSKLWILIILMVVIVSILVVVWIKFETALAPIVPFNTKAASTANKPDKKASPVATTSTPAKPSSQSNKINPALSDPASIWVIVNKSHPLNPLTYAPADLVVADGATISAKAKPDLDAMVQAASVSGISLPIVSSYRSYGYQLSLYNNYVSIYGQAATDTFSARAGYSEHQTCFAIDFGSNTQTTCNLDTCFDQTPEGKWLADNAYKFGFLLRYTTAKQSITGYKNEPWHYRSIGRDLAQDMKIKGILTLVEYFDISGGEVYI